MITENGVPLSRLLAYETSHLIAGSWSTPLGGRSAAIPPEGKVTGVPLHIHRTADIDRIGCNVTVAGTTGALVRLGIYSSDTQGEPTSLLVDAGTVSAESTGAKEITISETLPPGLFWLVAVVQGGAGTRPTLTMLADVGVPSAPGSSALLSSARSGMGGNNGIISGAFPSTNTFPMLYFGDPSPIAVAVRFA